MLASFGLARAVVGVMADDDVYVCGECGTSFPTRNALFKHLRKTCLPAVATLDVPKVPPQRVALLIGYEGDRWFGLKMNGPADELARPSIAATVFAATQRAWGEGVVTSANGEAVRTEKGASACVNLLLLTLQRGSTGDKCDADSLRRELPATITLLDPPRILEPARQGEEVFKLVRSQVHSALVPFSALVRPSAQDDATGTSSADCDDGRRTARLWLAGLPDGCTAADVRELLRHVDGCESLGEPTAPSGTAPSAGCEVDFVSMVAEDGAWSAEATLPSAAALRRTLGALDGLQWRGVRLRALEGGEADAKRAVHLRLQAVLGTLGKGTSFHNFIQTKGSVSAGGAARRLQLASSSFAADVRASAGARAPGAWQAEDWVELRFAAREFGAQQVRRLVGVCVALVRGVEGDEYLARCLNGRQHVATPLAPSESQCLLSFSLEAHEAAA